MFALREAHPTADISVVGSSAGALIGLAVLKKAAVPVTLLSPPLASFHELTTDPSGTDIPLESWATPTRIYRLVQSGSSARFTRSDSTQLDSLKSFAGPYFGKSLAEQISDLPRARRKCVRIVLGDADKRIKISALPKLRSRHSDIPVTLMKGMGHRPANPEEALAVGRLLTEAAAHPCRSDRGR